MAPRGTHKEKQIEELEGQQELSVQDTKERLVWKRKMSKMRWDLGRNQII